jgi:hypothetical protein
VLAVRMLVQFWREASVTSEQAVEAQPVRHELVEMVLQGSPLDTIVRGYAQAVTAQRQAEVEAAQRADDAEFAQACHQLRVWLNGYLPGVWGTLTRDEAELEFVRHREWYSKLSPPVTFFVGGAHLKLVQVSTAGVIEVSNTSGKSQRLGFTEDAANNWLRFVDLLASLAGELPQ